MNESPRRKALTVVALGLAAAVWGVWTVFGLTTLFFRVLPEHPGPGVALALFCMGLVAFFLVVRAIRKPENRLSLGTTLVVIVLGYVAGIWLGVELMPEKFELGELEGGYC